MKKAGDAGGALISHSTLAENFWVQSSSVTQTFDSQNSAPMMPITNTLRGIFQRKNECDFQESNSEPCEQKASMLPQDHSHS